MLMLRWITGGAVLAAILTALTIALWPMSETEQARQDGENIGHAVVDLRNAETTGDVDSALDDLHASIRDARDHAGDAVYDQVEAQGDAIYHAVNGFIGATESDDGWDQELYEEELDQALEDLASQAEDFRTGTPEVAQAFGEGLQDGLSES
jgi:hypothetical protein